MKLKPNVAIQHICLSGFKLLLFSDWGSRQFYSDIHQLYYDPQDHHNHHRRTERTAEDHKRYTAAHWPWRPYFWGLQLNKSLLWSSRGLCAVTKVLANSGVQARPSWLSFWDEGWWSQEQEMYSNGVLMQGLSNGYIAMGLSRDERMGDDLTTSCLIEVSTTS